ncbi:MAG: FtsQ-type POTRA domain-containing protein [Actinomycetota bacterium]|nr:FtsQ-type POTRA domain-containing protein [Actinomycetota bacterium]
MGSAPPRERARTTVVPFPHSIPRGGGGTLRLLPSGRSLLVGFGLLALAAGSYAIARETPMFAVRTIEVRGGTPRVQAHVRTALASLEGTNLLKVGAASVARRLETLPDVGSARFDRAFPHTLKVFVRAEAPIAVVRRGADAWLVSANARVIRSVEQAAGPALPRIWVSGSADVQSDGSLKDAAGVEAIRSLAALQAARWPIHVRLVKLEDGEVSFVLRSGLELRLGSTRLLPLKFAVAGRILAIVRSTMPDARYIDVSVPARPVAA